MQIPTEWNIHILPGLLIILSVAVTLTQSTREELGTWVKEQNIVSSVFAVVAAYTLGFSMNVVAVEIIKPRLQAWELLGQVYQPSIEEHIRFYVFYDEKVRKVIVEGYNYMVLLRSFFGGFTILSILSIYGLVFRRDYLGYRLLVFLVATFASYGFFEQWSSHRQIYYDALKDAIRVMNGSS